MEAHTASGSFSGKYTENTPSMMVHNLCTESNKESKSNKNYQLSESVVYS